MHFHPNAFPPPLLSSFSPPPPHVLFLLIAVPPSIPTSVPLLSSSSLLTCLSLFPLFFLPCHLHPPPRPPSILSIFLGCGCDVSAVTLISSGDVSILSVLLLHHQHPPFLLLSYLVCLHLAILPTPRSLSSSLSSLFFSSSRILLIPATSHLFFHPCPHVPSSVFVCVRVCVCCLSAVTVSSSALELSAFFWLLHKNTACPSKKAVCCSNSDCGIDHAAATTPQALWEGHLWHFVFVCMCVCVWVCTPPR